MSKAKFFRAARDGDLNSVKKFLTKKEVDINSKNI